MTADGVQVACYRPGEGWRTLATGHDGCGRPVDDTTLQPLHCAGKPVIAVALAVVLGEAGLGLGTEVGTVVPDAARTAVGALTLHDLLAHRTALYRFATPVGQLVPAPLRRSWLLSLDARAGHRQVYDDYVGWLLLQLVIEELTGSPLQAVVRRSVIEPWDLAGEVFCGFDPSSYRENISRIAVAADALGERLVPRLIERSPRAALDVRSSLSVYASMRGLAGFYQQLGTVVAGGSTALDERAVALVRTLVTPRPATYDPVLRRSAPFGLGFMTTLAEHSFGPTLSASSFGHSGLAGATLGCHDPATGDSLAVAWSRVIEPTESVHVRRPVLVEELLSR